MSQSFHFVPGSPDNAPAQPAAPAAPAQPRESIEQVGGMTRFSMRFDAPKGQDIENPDLGTPADETGHVRIRTSNQSHVQSYTVTPDSGRSTSFCDINGNPMGPRSATHVLLPRGDGTFDKTNVKGAEAMGLVVNGADGWQATGKALRGGKVYEPHEIPAMQQAEYQQARERHVMETLKAVEAMHGKQAFGKMVAEHFAGGGTVQSLVAGILGEEVPQQQFPHQRGEPAIRPLTAEEMAARQPAPAAVDPAANIPDVVDARIPQLAAVESAMTEGLNPSAVQALKAAFAASLAAGDEASMKLAISNLAAETGCTPARAQEITNAIGKNVGQPIAVVAARVGLQPQQLIAALRQADSEEFSAAISQLSQSRNAAKLVKLTTRVLAAHQRRGK